MTSIAYLLITILEGPAFPLISVVMFRPWRPVGLADCFMNENCCQATKQKAT
jgi:hypothetical protein